MTKCYDSRLAMLKRREAECFAKEEEYSKFKKIVIVMINSNSNDK